MMYKVSVIVPVYNAEKYLNRCLESILRQKGHFDYEIVVVNDGSTDNSLKILNSYQEKYKGRIILIDQPNKGVSETRRIGFSKSNGELITFVDSDDYLSPNFLDSAINTLNDTQTNLVCVRTVYHPDFPIIKNIFLLSRHRPRSICISKNKELLPTINCVVTSKIWKREYVELDDSGLRIMEDVAVNYTNYVQANAISFDNNSFYHYAPNGSGLVATEILAFGYNAIKNSYLALKALKK